MKTGISRTVFRIIDANANRLREGLRVIEEVGRFSLERQSLARKLKEMRRLLAMALARMDRVSGGSMAMALLRARDSQRDVGRDAAAVGRVRGGVVDVCTANFKRVEEAARVLEEYGAIYDAEASGLFEQIRYVAYDLEALTIPALSRAASLAEVRLCVLATESVAGHDLPTTVRAAIRGGADMIQYRNKELEDGEFAARAGKLQEICRRAGVLFIVNDRVGVCAAIGADGVHLGRYDLTPAAARAVLGADRIIGVSASTLSGVRGARRAGADYIGAGAVFPSLTKGAAGGRPSHTRGVLFIRRACGGTEVPVFAIGGIAEDNVDALVAVGCRRIAVCSTAIAAADVERAVRRLKKRLLSASG